MHYTWLSVIITLASHDYSGRSTARGAFMIWTHHLKDISYNASFIPEGAPPSETYNGMAMGSVLIILADSCNS